MHRFFVNNLFESVWNQICSFLVLCCASSLLFAQSADISGYIKDQTGATVAQASVELRDQDTGVRQRTRTNNDGIYSLPGLKPGTYSATVQAKGFKTVTRDAIVLNAAERISLDFSLEVGAVTETVTVEGDAPLLQTETAVVGTVVNRQFVANMPLNGRSFESLIELSAGVVYTSPTSNISSQGQQFAINGQRQDANNFTVDGASANSGVGTAISIGAAGTGNTGFVAANGGLNGLISVDNLQEFSIQTSSFAPEYGRSPGGQIFMVTRSGANQFTGSVFDYFRNTVLDANNWFNNANNLPLAAERQNDFGGVFGGPVVRNKLFFFYSYEGLRLLLPANGSVYVPSITPGFGRTAVPASLQKFFNAFPVPNGPANPADPNLALFTSSWSNPSNLDNHSIRLDYLPLANLTVFGRFSNSPSEGDNRTGSLSTVRVSTVRSKSLTLGSNYLFNPATANEFRLNSTWSSGGQQLVIDNFGGAVPYTDADFYPPGYNSQNSLGGVGILNGSSISTGKNVNNPQYSFNVVDSVSLVRSTHQFKFGVDYRRLHPTLLPRIYGLTLQLLNSANYLKGIVDNVSLQARTEQEYLFTNYSAYAQDTWKASSRLTFTYGLRWDINPPPSSPNNKGGFTLTPLVPPVSAISIQPYGTPPYPTHYRNFAPRAGVAYRLTKDSRFGTVLRGGFGLFYDTADSGSANWIGPNGAVRSVANAPTPLSAAAMAPPSLPSLPPYNIVAAAPTPASDLQSPYVYQTNVTIEQALGKNQALTVSYVGAFGRRLLRSETFQINNATFTNLTAVTNNASSSYNSLQTKFQRRLSRGLQVLSTFTWAHSIDNASLPDSANGNSLQPGFIDRDRGNSDFDIRTMSSTAVSYSLPTPVRSGISKALLGSWGIDLIYRYAGGSVFNVVGNTVIDPGTGTNYTSRPNLNLGVPLWVNGNYPGGKRVNFAAFTPAPAGKPGNLGRNVLRGFPAHDVDLALRREFPIYEKVRLQFRSDFFNILNHPSFSNPPVNLAQPATFGIANSLLSNSLANVPGQSLYQIGSPRSVQLSMKLVF